MRYLHEILVTMEILCTLYICIHTIITTHGSPFIVGSSDIIINNHYKNQKHHKN
jgi:hypothetical protein